MQAELKEGDRVLVEGQITKVDTRTGYPFFVATATHGDLRFAEDELIPIPPPLPAPNCEGAWVQRFDSGDCYGRHVVMESGQLGYFDADGDWEAVWLGTWYPIDPRLLGVEVEEPKPKDPLREFYSKADAIVSKAHADLLETARQLQPTPPPPGDET